jgi:hypothetical protein
MGFRGIEEKIGQVSGRMGGGGGRAGSNQMIV